MRPLSQYEFEEKLKNLASNNWKVKNLLEGNNGDYNTLPENIKTLIDKELKIERRTQMYLLEEDIFYFLDRKENKYKIEEWTGSDVTMCGYFSGSISNYHEWIYANLGYQNKIKKIINIDTKQEYSLGQIVELKEYHPEGPFGEKIRDIKFATIKEFHIDSFSRKIEAIFEEQLYPLNINQLM